MKILIVEDEPALRELIQQTLEKERYVVETAEDLAGAMEKVGVYDYECILLDLMLPDGSGLSLLEEIKRLRKKESVIIISAKDSIDDDGHEIQPAASYRRTAENLRRPSSDIGTQPRYGRLARKRAGAYQERYLYYFRGCGNA